MKEFWTKNWKKALLWLSGYLSIIAFAVVGGYIIVRSEDQDLRRSAKTCFIVVLIFAAIDAFVLILNNILGLSYSGGFADFLRWFDFFETLARVAVFAVFTVMALVGGGQRAGGQSEQETPAKEETESEDQPKE